jgi:hypothetical protein
MGEMIRSGLLALACVWGSQFVSGCQGDDGGDDGAAGAAARGDGAATIDDFISAYCDLVRDCCGAAGLPAEPLADCEAELERQMDVVASVRAGTTELVEPAFGRCVSEIRTQAGSCGFPRMGAGDSSCNGAFRGTVPEGGACEDAVECEPGDVGPRVCLRAGDAAGDSESGVCVATRAVDVGESCLFDYAGNASFTIGTPDPNPPRTYCDRRDGLYCPSFEDTCAELPGPGEPCDYDCDAGLWCDEAAGTCAPTLGEGEACSGGRSCAEGLWCRDGRCAVVSIADTEICEGDFN